MKDSQYLRVFFTIIVLFLVVSLIETAILSNIVFLPAVPDLCLLCVLFVSISNGRFFGEVGGFVSGFMLDFLTASPFGLNALFRCIVGYCFGFFNKVVNINGFFIPMLFGGCATITKALLLLLISFFFPMSNIKFSPFNYYFLFELVENIILAPFVFKILGMFKDLLILKPENVI